MRDKLRRAGTVVAAMVLAGTVVAGCDSVNNFRDVEGVRSQDPDKIEVYNNVDQHPNLVMVCIHGVAFITTTRDYKPFEREEDLDRNCPNAVVK
jgi:hypothetical protein